MGIWAAGTELYAVLQAPAVAQRLGGTCKEMVRDVDPAVLRNGRTDPLTGVQTATGLEVLIEGLWHRHGQFEIETATSAIIELLQFRRRQNESVDESLSRFETLRRATRDVNGFELPIPVVSWLALEAMEIPKPMWPLCAGTIPQHLPREHCSDLGDDRQLAPTGAHSGTYHGRTAEMAT